MIPGSIVGCSGTDSIFLSTLECFYSDSICFPILKNYLRQTYVLDSEDPLWLYDESLIYNATSTRFERNTSMSTIIRDLMIEQWNPSYSYESFFQLCSPNYCIYQQTIHKNNAIGIIVVLISMIGGLIVSMRLIAPYLVIFTIKFISRITGKQKQPTRPAQLEQRGTFS